MQLVTFSLHSVLLFFVSGWCRRKRKFVSPGRSLRAARRARQISLSATGTEPSRRGGDASSACNGSVVTGAGSVGGYNWAELQRQGGSTGGSAYRCGTLSHVNIDTNPRPTDLHFSLFLITTRQHA